jgi:hypothetical protein
MRKKQLPQKQIRTSEKVESGVLQAASFGQAMWRRDYQLQAWRLNNSSLAVRAAIKLSDAATLTGRGLLSTPVVNEFSLYYFAGIPIASDFSAARVDSLMVKRSQYLYFCLQVYSLC